MQQSIRAYWQMSGLASLVLLTACDGAGQQPAGSQSLPKAPSSPPPVTSVVRYYADLMAHDTPLNDFSHRLFADSGLVVAQDKQSFTQSLTNCELEARLDSTQRLSDLFIDAPAQPLKPGQPLSFSHAPIGRLVRLGELRRAFGPGKIERPLLAEMVAMSRFPVSFRYHPTNSRRAVEIEASMPTPRYADTARVHSISIAPVTAPE